ncbi:hypothetical protein ARMGADRAFT_1086932 [Armillaria gallica]|uniref:Uncharacterized protein n=1 Tax=Armillaria gallica TaxID=47427 RepID=A0A2H3CS72_ARMGA|nr:hypothetical protein ARMGADRAFT_1086932 [Armillaria gallica]
MSDSMHSEGSMKRQEGSVRRRPSTILAAMPVPRYSRPHSTLMETHGEAPLPPTQHRLATPLTLERALYLLSMGELTTVPEILFRAPIIDLFNHFTRELVEDPNWAVTPAGIDYTHYGYSYILKEEARHFTCVA